MHPYLAVVSTAALALCAASAAPEETTPAPGADRPSWWGSTEGISEAVPEPWTPVRRQGSQVRVWGRSYRLGPLPLPAEIKTAGESILAGPITLDAVVDGRRQVWRQGGPLEVDSAQPNRLVVATRASSDLLRCVGHVTTEYDGLLRSDLVIQPDGARQIDHLSLEIPIRPEFALYLYTFPGQWGSSRNAQALPEEDWDSPFKPIVWIGDNDRGLEWFAESDEGFRLADPDHALEIRRTGDAIMLRVNLITTPQLAENLEFSFGFQATPVKPLTPDVWDYRICHHGGYGIEDQRWSVPATLTYPAEGQIDLKQGTFEAWVRPRFDPQPKVDPEDPARGALNRNLFDLLLADESRIGFYWNIDDLGMRVYCRQGAKTFPVILGSRAPWQRDEWHHVAFTWGERLAIYFDGALVAETPYRGLLDAPLEDARIVLGEGQSDFDFDEVRISDAARGEFDLTRAPEADARTLLLDHLDADPAAGGTTSPARGQGAKAAGWVSGQGHFGKAFARADAAMGTTILDRLAQLGVRTVVFHEHWTDIQNYTSTTHGEKLHKLVKACHDRGIKLLLYFGYEISDIAPEFATYADEMLAAPRQGGYTRQPPQTAYIVCYQSKWQDFMADGIARVMDEYDIDGVYLDGTEYPWGCTNTRHGCGYTRPDGTVGTTWSIYGAREMLRRIYNIVKSRKPDGQINVHNSTCMAMPSLAFATSSWDGEQLGSMEPGPDPLTVLPLDTFRCEFMGRQWGVPAEFLCYDRPYTWSQALSFTLLHDVLLRGSLGGSLEAEAKLWQAMDDFGRHEATWLPYWDNGRYVTLGPDASIKSSLYWRPGKGVVAVISNLGPETSNAEVRLNTKSLKLDGDLQATDILSDNPVNVTRDGRMSFTLPSFGFRVVWVRER